ncbi:MAG: S1/P1 Nuclease, partial [Bacteroidia bacterium]|nr:S1/P1 Nuclease [Bacteroidia bacterium]
YHTAMGTMVERRMKKAIYTTGCFWYTAWIDAGQPDLNFISAQRKDLQPEIDSLRSLMSSQIKGRMETH